MFTHARCGGNLLPIAKTRGGVPSPSRWNTSMLVRCDRCRLEGEVAQQMTYDRERRELWRDLEWK